jgi:CRP/FNR family transcriptional regulator, cyclic AMP receptor protein
MNVIWSNVFKLRSGGTGQTQITEILKKIPVFEDLTKRELGAIERILHKREYRQDELIFREGEPGVGMYIIESGKVRIVTETGKRTLAELAEGEFFGELALLDESPRSATAIAIQPCSILGFFQPDLFGLIERNPQLGVKIVLRLARSIGERLRRANEQLQKHESTPGKKS